MAVPTIPTITELYNRIIQDFENEYGQTVPILSRSFLRVWAKILAGSFWLCYKFAQKVSVNILPTTALGDRLDDWGLIVDIERTKATQWTGSASVTGDNGSLIQAGSLYVAANNVQYITTTTIEIASGVGVISLQAQQSGTIGNLAVGSQLSLVSPQSGIQPTAIVTASTNEAEDRETDDAYRSRIVDRFASRPQGGALIDYVVWCQSVSGVTRVFPYDAGTGSVSVYFLRDNDVDRIPDTTEITEVFNAINLPYRRPLGCTVNVYAPTDTKFNVTITGFTGDASAQASLSAEIEQYFLGKEMYVDANISETNCNLLSSFDIIALVVQYGSATSVSYEVNGVGTPLTTYTLAEGEVSSINTITFA